MKISAMSVGYVDHMGDDLSVVNAARVSFDKVSEYQRDFNISASGEPYVTSQLSDKDAKLIKYLADHNHWTPFGHAAISLRIKAPIFVARQLVKHQVGLVWNEVSRRYVDDEPEFWFPQSLRGRPVNAKQGSSGEVASIHIREIEHVCHYATDKYNLLLKEGVAPEQARMVLPLNTMTEWIWTGSLMAFSRVCKLRLDAHAQAETREVAEQVDKIVSGLFPVSWKALMNDKTTID